MMGRTTCAYIIKYGCQWFSRMYGVLRTHNASPMHTYGLTHSCLPRVWPPDRLSSFANREWCSRLRLHSPLKQSAASVNPASRILLLKRPRYRFACSPGRGGSFLSKNHFFFFCRAESDSGSTISIGIPGTCTCVPGGGTISVAFCLFGRVPAGHVQRGREGGVAFRPPPPPV